MQLGFFTRRFVTNQIKRMSKSTDSTKDKLIFAPNRYQYSKSSLHKEELEGKDPLLVFNDWFHEATEDPAIQSPESSTLSSARLPSGRVSSRLVLLKELDRRGFIIFTNLGTSKKAEDWKTNPYASLSFWWESLQRQVRVEGMIERLSREETEEYFQTRPRLSRIGAWASPQSTVIQNRKELEERVQSYKEKFGEDEPGFIPAPEFWGGIRIVPLEIEFWQGGQYRLHDRFSFRRDDLESNYQLVRLAP
ncbi:pyridoxamine 5'-phosphate oxidase [Schizosaccharomyces cryophilus OY26]|uniref:pyridoxal 5'-phosphate synthase n=1 Tax=Schizosaccharomyces cryophilus (strain OY26 / ATCC MYA-4695 / CBS 11777 / NBRC 106824 / NRRL Y48691) TaxID=653667 RepID=S9VWU0_SCHCR|nr:pyridoxamine 5'-phosphate oxidase [Schizosaccharomyces cryophilus OY26]EPY50410.1 pyridoxamine 5'-phosphate oxidase [Schizosaccharomyces cryophilus OY26]